MNKPNVYKPQGAKRVFLPYLSPVKTEPTANLTSFTYYSKARPSFMSPHLVKRMVLFNYSHPLLLDGTGACNLVSFVWDLKFKYDLSLKIT